MQISPENLSFGFDSSVFDADLLTATQSQGFVRIPQFFGSPERLPCAEGSHLKGDFQFIEDNNSARFSYTLADAAVKQLEIVSEANAGDSCV